MRYLLLVALLLGCFNVTSPTLLAAAPSQPPAAYSVYLPAVTIPPPALRVLSSSVYADPYPFEQRFGIVGEIVNDSAEIIHSAYVTVRFYDAADVMVERFDVYAALPLVKPGQRVPFKAWAFTLPPEALSYDVEAHPGTYVVPAYNELTIVAHQVQQSISTEVVGEARYERGPLMVSSRIVVTFYDGQGRVVDVAIGAVEVSPLPAGVNGHFNTFTNRTFDFASYTVQGGGFCY